MKKVVFVIFAVVSLSLVCLGQNTNGKAKQQISRQLSLLVKAHLTSDAKIAGGIYDDRLILTSQSGRVYGKNDSLKNIKNKFGFYKNSDVRFLHLKKNIVVVNYINEREIGDFPRAKYRVTTVWLRRKGAWKIVSLQSSKIRMRKQ